MHIHQQEVKKNEGFISSNSIYTPDMTGVEPSTYTIGTLYTQIWLAEIC